MSTVGQREKRTQQRVVDFFTDALDYAYLGHWKDRVGNSNIEKELLTAWLKRQGHSDQVIDRVRFPARQGGSTGREQDTLRRQPRSPRTAPLRR